LRAFGAQFVAQGAAKKYPAYFRGNGANPPHQEQLSFLLAKYPITQKAKTNLGILTIP
jgi:hypothetical protein